jgi:hypothetical protein
MINFESHFRLRCKLEVKKYVEIWVRALALLEVTGRLSG